MGHIGHFGKLSFDVKTVKGKPYALSFDGIKWDTSINVEEHKRQGQKPLLEVISRNADKISMDISLSASLGVSPLKKMMLLRDYNLKSKIFPLGIGGKRIGGFKWLITDISNDMKAFYRNGHVMKIQTSITLKEYAYKKSSKKKKLYQDAVIIEDIIGKKSKGYQKYTVKSGDTLWTIAKKFYKKSTLYYVIYNANKKASKGFDKISNPLKLKAGMVIKIPHR